MFQDLRNSIDFFIRNKTKFSRKNFVEKDPEILERNKLENLYTKDVLTKYFEQRPKKKVRVLDIGSKNWFYAKGEYAFFEEFCSEIQLDGVEIDAYRLYSNFYSRYEVAKFNIKGLNGVNYIPEDLLNIKEKYDYITWFLPFVVIRPHLFWGLPKKYFCPLKMLAHAYSLLNTDGQMLIVNQGAEEAQAQKILFEKLGISYVELGVVKSEYFEYKNKRYGFLIKK